MLTIVSIILYVLSHKASPNSGRPRSTMYIRKYHPMNPTWYDLSNKSESSEQSCPALYSRSSVVVVVTVLVTPPFSSYSLFTTVVGPK